MVKHEGIWYPSMKKLGESARINPGALCTTPRRRGREWSEKPFVLAGKTISFRPISERSDSRIAEVGREASVEMWGMFRYITSFGHFSELCFGVEKSIYTVASSFKRGSGLELVSYTDPFRQVTEVVEALKKHPYLPGVAHPFTVDGHIEWAIHPEVAERMGVALITLRKGIDAHQDGGTPFKIGNHTVECSPPSSRVASMGLMRCFSQLDEVHQETIREDIYNTVKFHIPYDAVCAFLKTYDPNVEQLVLVRIGGTNKIVYRLLGIPHMLGSLRDFAVMF